MLTSKQKKEITDVVKEALKEAGVSPKDLEVEIVPAGTPEEESSGEERRDEFRKVLASFFKKDQIKGFFLVGQYDDEGLFAVAEGDTDELAVHFAHLALRSEEYMDLVMKTVEHISQHKMQDSKNGVAHLGEGVVALRIPKHGR